MLLAETIRKIVELQEKNFQSQETWVNRDLLDSIDVNVHKAIIISGIRRCGKSTLLKQLMGKTGNCNFFNFEDSRANGFDLNDFDKLSQVFTEMHPGMDCYYFDEIQVVPEWERFVRGELDIGKKFAITGSNASLLSIELGTKLTGRHLTYELFPFSYAETLRMKRKSPSPATFDEYIERGGFPEYVLSGTQDILQQLFTDIITRDIVVRYGLRNASVVQDLALHLLSNVGSEFSYTNLAKTYDLAPNTVRDYISYFMDSYLLFTVPKFSYSVRKTAINPKKIYAIDHALIKANTLAFTANNGSLLENIVFLELRRYHNRNSIYYYKEDKRECDFIVTEKRKPVHAIQVCYKLTPDNFRREVDGVKEAMSALGLDKGLIITMDQTDKFDNVEIVPAWKWLTASVPHIIEPGS